MTKSNITNVMLVKYLHGELPERENVIVAYAISEDAGVKKHFEQLQLIWNESAKVGMKSNIDVDDAWYRLRERIERKHGEKRKYSFQAYNRWLRVAAVLLLFASAAGLNYYNRDKGNSSTPVQENVSFTTSQSATNPGGVVVIKKLFAARLNTGGNKKNNAPGNDKHNTALVLDHKRSTKEIVCNSTRSSMEICIIQKLKCENGDSSLVATCSKLDPDESNTSLYEAMKEKKFSSCKAVIDEITIKRVSTGETIILNADSKPLTAGEMFSYISGRKKGDVLAGTFDADCLAFDSRTGDFILQQCQPGDIEHCD